MKNIFTKSILVCLMITSILACQKDNEPTLTSAAAKKVAVLDAPTISKGDSTDATITLTVTAGATGAPAGFSVQWMTKADFIANGKAWPTDSLSTPASFCKASFSGVPGASFYNLKPGQSVSVAIGSGPYDQVGASSSCESQDLICGTEYVFRSFAHTDPAKGGKAKSVWSNNFFNSTEACPDVNCGHHFGYWKDAEFPASVIAEGMLLGTSVNYDAATLRLILNSSAKNNAVMILAHQLICAKLNYAAGLRGTDFEASIVAGDNLIGNRNLSEGTSASLEEIKGLNGKLNNFKGTNCQ